MEIMDACDDGVCGGHFARDITSQKILQAGFVWPSCKGMYIPGVKHVMHASVLGQGG